MDVKTETYERVSQGMRMFNTASRKELEAYLNRMKTEDPLALSVLQVQMAIHHHEYADALRRGKRLLSKVSEDSRLAWFLLVRIGAIYRMISEVEASENYFIRALEIGQQMQNLEMISKARMHLVYLKFSKGEYHAVYPHVQEIAAREKPPNAYGAHYMLSLLDAVQGRPDKALKTQECFLESIDPVNNERWWFSLQEMRGLSLRLMGRLNEAAQASIESARGFADFGSTYAAFPCAKALQISRLGALGAPPSDLIKRCVALAKKGSHGEQAAAMEIKALLKKDDAQTAQMLLEIARQYSMSYQPLEAFMAGLSSAFFAWKTTNPVFPEALKFLTPLLPVHTGFTKDPLLGEFMIKIKPLLAQDTETIQGIRAQLLGEFKVFVNGKRLLLEFWNNKKAVKALIYLLLSRQHKLPKDHLFYLLWPRKSYNQRGNRKLLYTAISAIRKGMARPDLLRKQGDFYELNDVWTDLFELENLLNQAQSLDDPVKKERYLIQAQQMARADLLPEFPYDPHIDEYRQYYQRIRERISSMTIGASS